MINKILQTDKMADERRKSVLVPIYKKGDVHSTEGVDEPHNEDLGKSSLSQNGSGEGAALFICRFGKGV